MLATVAMPVMVGWRNSPADMALNSLHRPVCPWRSAPWLWKTLWATEVKSASRINGAVVVFVDRFDKADQLEVAGVTVKGELTLVFPLLNPVKKVIASNVPPFLKNNMWLRELSRRVYSL